MSKYDSLWKAVKESEEETLSLNFGEIEAILGFPIDHAFLSFKKELSAYGYEVKKISRKQETVFFEKLKEMIKNG